MPRPVDGGPKPINTGKTPISKKKKGFRMPNPLDLPPNSNIGKKLSLEKRKFIQQINSDPKIHLVVLKEFSEKLLKEKDQ